MSIENLLPRDLVTIVTKDGMTVKAEVTGIKRDRLQLQIHGPWLTERQFKDARQSVRFREIAEVERTGRAPDPRAILAPKVVAPSAPSYVMSFFQFMRQA